MKRINWNRTKQLAIILALAVLAGSLLPSPSAYAQAAYSFSDQTSSVKATGNGTYLSGDHMVWYAKDAKGRQSIFYKNIKTGASKQITNYSSLKGSPRVTVTDAGKVVVIWIDNRYVGGSMYNVMAKYIDSNKEFQLSSTIAPHNDVTVSGNIVAWGETWHREMFYYDLSANKEVPLGKGTRPQVANGKIAFINDSGDVALHTIATGRTDILVELPYHLFPTAITYNGTIVVWKESDLDWQTKYVMLDTAEPSAKPVDLTEKSDKAKEFSQLFLGSGQAAWIEWKNGVLQLTGADLKHRETYMIAQGNSVLKTSGFVGDRLVMQGVDGSLVFRTITRTE